MVDWVTKMARKDKALDAAADALDAIADTLSDAGHDVSALRETVETIRKSIDREPDGSPTYWIVLRQHIR